MDTKGPKRLPEWVATRLIEVEIPKTKGYLRQKYGLSEHDALDIIQAAFQAAIEEFPHTYKATHTLGAWFFWIVLDRIAEHFRGKQDFIQLSPEIEENLAFYPRIVSATLGDGDDNARVTHHQAIRDQMMTALISVLNELKPREREVLLWWSERSNSGISPGTRNTAHWVDGLDDVLGLTTNHIRRILADARKKVISGMEDRGHTLSSSFADIEVDREQPGGSIPNRRIGLEVVRDVEIG